MRIHRWLGPVFIGFLVLGMLIPLSPLFRPVPSDDPSVYLYMGRTILGGGIPYLHAWDHKQPLAFFLFALGQAITPHSLWGMWVIELGLLAATGLLGLRLVEKLASRWLAVLSVAAALLTLALLLWGYSLEELALPLQMVPLYGLWRILEVRKAGQRAAWGAVVGASAGLAFFLKQSLVGAALAVGLYLFLRLLFQRAWGRWVELAGMAAGFALVAVPVLGYLTASGALGAYWDAAFAFNLAYANLGLLERANALLNTVEELALSPGLFLAFALWLACSGVTILQAGPDLARWACRRGVPSALAAGGGGLMLVSLAGEWVGGEPGLGLVQTLLLLAGAAFVLVAMALHTPAVRQRVTTWLAAAPLLPDGDPRGPFFALSSLLFPLTLGLMTLSGRNYGYYFITFIPGLMLAFALGGSLLFGRLDTALDRPAMVVLFGVGLALAYNPVLLLVSQYRESRNPPGSEIAHYVQTNTRPDDPILVWGKDTTYVYFAAQRHAPSRYFYQAPLALETYNARFGVSEELLHDLERNPPTLFLILGDPLAPGASCPFAGPAETNTPGQVLEILCRRYTYAAHMDGFQVYQFTPGSQ